MGLARNLAPLRRPCRLALTRHRLEPACWPVEALGGPSQLMRAARDVGPAARPLPLFYALSQAGRAIAAAHLADNEWRLAGHGLSVPPQDHVPDLLRRVVEPQEGSKKARASGRRSSFGGVADAVGSEPLTDAVELRASVRVDEHSPS